MIYRFQDYSLDVKRRELRWRRDLVPVEPQVLDLLQYLIRNRDHVVSKDELIAAVWNGRIISDSAFSSRITAVRHAIGDSGEQQGLIRTIARKGFRFVGDIQEQQTSEDGASANSPLQTTQTVTPQLILPDKPSIAVLPFQNLSGDPEQEYLAGKHVGECGPGLHPDNLRIERTEAHRAGEVLDCRFRLSMKDPCPAACPPRAREIRIEREGAIDKGKGIIEIADHTSVAECMGRLRERDCVIAL